MFVHFEPIFHMMSTMSDLSLEITVNSWSTCQKAPSTFFFLKPKRPLQNGRFTRKLIQSRLNKQKVLPISIVYNHRQLRKKRQVVDRILYRWQRPYDKETKLNQSLWMTFAFRRLSSLWPLWNNWLDQDTQTLQRYRTFFCDVVECESRLELRDSKNDWITKVWS